MTSHALIIEDDPDIGRLLGLLLGRHGWSHEWVTTLVEGVRRADTHPHPEIILLDLQLADSLTENTIRRIPDLMRNGPVLVLSYNDNPDVATAVAKQGAFYCLKDTTGPTVFNAMVQAIRTYRTGRGNPKKLTDRIDLNFLEMQAIESKHASR